ncbi:MAG: DUF1989 domain-containing protein [Opitutales bacterium]
MLTEYKESSLREEDAICSEFVKAGDGWLKLIKKGQTVRIVDSEGNQSADTLFYNADDISEHYNVQNTLACQGNALLGTGSILYSQEGNPMLEIVADTCGEHDTLGSACSCESNCIRYGFHTRFMHACREIYMKEAMKTSFMDKRDLVDNVNFFMHVALDDKGNLNFTDGISKAGKYVEMKALMNIYILEANCPQLNNPCNDYNPTPIQMLIWD